MTFPRRAQLETVDLPDFGMPQTTPVIPDRIYSDRLDRLRAQAEQRGLDHVIVYADREHSANISYLTGFDPRFEEALMVVGQGGRPVILVGNECVGMAESAPLAMDVRLFQEFSLPGQPRASSAPLSKILMEAGISAGRRVGAIGWKTFSDSRLLDIPSFLADETRAAVASTGDVVNVTDIMIDAADGLRVINEVEQLAFFEHAACQTSHGVRRLMFELEPGMTEHEAARLLDWNGAPLSCHLMLTGGDRASLGLLSPSDRPIGHGDPMTVAFGIWGALNCRAGFVVEGAADLPSEIRDYVDVLVGPYFETVVEWYEALHLGQRGGALQEIVDRRLGDPFFGISLNPGHQLHLDEWVNTPVRPGSEIELRSGMAMQVDIIPSTGTRYFTTNIEDGIALADASLRSEFAEEFPDAWSRIEARRRFMREALGIQLQPEVLPLSNIPGHLAPFLLRPDRAMTAHR